MCIALLSFWVEDSLPFFWIYSKLLFILGGLLIPLSFFPGWLRRIAEALPFRTVLFGPARLFVKGEPGTVLDLLLWQGLWILLFALVAHGMFAVGREEVACPGRMNDGGRLRGAFVLELLRLNLMSAMAYRTSFIAQILFMAANNGIFMTFWWIFFQRFENLQGWEMGDVIMLYALGASGFGLAVALFGNATRLSTLIHQGQMDYYLVLPPDPPDPRPHVAHGRLRHRGPSLRDHPLRSVPALRRPPLLPLPLLLVPVAAIVFVSFCVLVHSLTFWMGSAEGISRFMGEALTTFALYPSRPLRRRGLVCSSTP